MCYDVLLCDNVYDVTGRLEQQAVAIRVKKEQELRGALELQIKLRDEAEAKDREAERLEAVSCDLGSEEDGVVLMMMLNIVTIYVNDDYCRRD